MPEPEITPEALRQLVAARDGRYQTNQYGRYVIDGEARPDRKTRETLMYSGLVTWQFRPTKALVLTARGHSALTEAGR